MTNRPAEAGAAISVRTLRMLWVAYLLAALAVGLVLLDRPAAGLALASVALAVGSWTLWDAARGSGSHPAKRLPGSEKAVPDHRAHIA